MAQKRYEYKIYRENEFLGVLDNVTSEFGYSQSINTAGAELSVEVGLNADNTSDDIEYLHAEDGSILQAENGDYLTVERNLSPLGSENPRNLIQNNNDLVVIEYSDTNVNGVTVFQGHITKWRTIFGDNNSVRFTALSNGDELENYVARSGSTLEITQDSQTGSRNISEDSDGSSLVGQNIDTGTWDLSRIDLYFTAIVDCTVIVKLYQGTLSDYDASETGNGVLLGTASRGISQNGTSALDPKEWFSFVFDSPIAVTAAGNYYFTVETGVRDSGPSGFGAIWIGTAAAGAYSLTGGYHYEYIAPYGSPRWVIGYEVLAFKVYSSMGNTTAEYTDTDPSDIVRDAMDSYTGQGGHVEYDSNTVEDTPYLVDYTFKVATVLEVIKKCLELAPSNWFWYVDPGDQMLYFKETSDTADHTFVKGRHFNKFELEANVEDVINNVLFTGGDTGGGENLFNEYINEDSVDEQLGRKKLKKLSDNRVTLDDTADTLANNFLEENSSEEYRSVMTIPSGVYDISTLNIGDVVEVVGFNNFMDTILLQITSIKRAPHSVDLNLGKLPLRTSSYIEQIKKDLEKQQTLANPDLPS